MQSYKDIYELATTQWEQDVDTTKSLSDKARTYVTVIGLVFGYSIFNFEGFLSLTGRLASTFPALALVVKILFSIYLLAFGIALIFTLCALRIRDFRSLPQMTNVAEFQPSGPSQDEAQKAYHELAKWVVKANRENLPLALQQARHLKFAINLLLAGSVALILIGLFLLLALFR